MVPPNRIEILHVDDDPDVVSMTAEYIERESDRIRVETATDVEEGLAHLETERVDCVVSDHDMSGMDGIEFLRRVREEHPELPFILYTGKGSEEVASDAISAGVSDYLQKGGGTDQYALLVNRITNLVSQYRAEQELQRERHRFRRLFENTNDAVAWIGYREPPPVTTDSTPVIRQANRAFRETFQSPGEEIVGRPLDEVVTEDGRREEAEAVSRQVLTGETQTAELTRDTVDGPRRFLWRAVLVESPRTGEVENSFAVYTDISTLRQRERELEATVARLDTVLSNAPLVLFALDGDGEFTLSKGKGLERLGLGPDEVVGQSIFDVYADHETVTAAARSALDGERVTGEYAVDGSVFDTTFQPVEEAGAVEAVIGVAIDVTERKENEARMNAERERLRTLFGQLTQPTVEVEYDGSEPVVRQVNPAFEAAFGFDEATLVGDSIDDYIVPDDREGEAAEINARAREGGRLESEEVTRLTADGPREFLLQNAVYEDGSGGFAVYIDITERRERERELERYRTLVETVGDPMYIIDEEGRIEMANAAMLDQLDADDDRVVGASIAEFMAEGDFERGTEVIRSLIDSPEQGWATFEMTAVSPAGRRIPAETNVAVLTDEAGEYRGSVGVVRDITERRNQERQLTEVREAYQTLIEASPTPIWVQGVEEIRYANEAAAEFYGVDEPADLVGESVLQFVPVDEREQVLAQNEVLLEEGEPLRELSGQVVTTDGRRRHAMFDAAPISYFGEPAIVTFGRDVTERRRRERELERQNDRLEEFAGVVSHDLRNPLSVATGRLALARDEVENQQLDAVAAAHDRMETMIEDLLSLARAGRMLGDVESVDLPMVVDDAWSSVEAGDARLAVETTAEIESDPGRLRQLFENLFRNAVEHGGEGVTVTVGDLEDGFFVEDDGPGIPAGQRQRVLDPGYSTAERGSGYGLSIVRDIAQAHGWRLSVEESAAGGARFEFADL
ncbi:MAG: PAS domain S-box protein [Halobacteriales archaeon]|nr:PAS domain S-box protein [Halobacteriales archaeon]